MEQNSDNRLPKNFIDGLADIPALPHHLYAGMRQRIDRKRVALRTVWAVAASLMLMVAAFQATRLVQPRTQSVAVAEAAEELSNVDSYINDGGYNENETSYGYYEETLYQE
jgi:hypothetical protein